MSTTSLSASGPATGPRGAVLSAADGAGVGADSSADGIKDGNSESDSGAPPEAGDAAGTPAGAEYSGTETRVTTPARAGIVIVASARKWGTTPEEKALYEFNAKDLITLWGDENCKLNEYACRQWSGLLSDFYKPRWQQFFTKAGKALEEGKEMDDDVFIKEIKNWEWQWVNKRRDYPVAPVGNTIPVSIGLYKKYRKALDRELR